MRIRKIDESPGFRYLLLAGIKPRKQERFSDSLQRLHDLKGVSVQVLNADLLAGEEHVVTASILAAKAWAGGRRIAKSQATELLLYVSGERQIKSAIKLMGVSENSAGWVVVALSDSIDSLRALGEKLPEFGEEDDGLIDLTDDKIPLLKKRFRIGNDEISIAERINVSKTLAVKSLVLERVALSDLYR